MINIEKVEKILGGRWVGVLFEDSTESKKDFRDDNLKVPEEPISFCEAVKESYTGPVALVPLSINCQGALYTFGWASEKEILISRISNESNIPKEIARKLVSNVPRMDNRITRIIVGTYRSPDMILSFAQPEAVMKLVRLWEKVYGTALNLSVSTIMAVCANVAVETYCTGKVNISFGCPVSRRYGNITRDRLVIGIPCALLDMLFANGF